MWDLNTLAARNQRQEAKEKREAKEDRERYFSKLLKQKEVSVQVSKALRPKSTTAVRQSW